MHAIILQRSSIVELQTTINLCLEYVNILKLICTATKKIFVHIQLLFLRGHRALIGLIKFAI